MTPRTEPVADPVAPIAASPGDPGEGTGPAPVGLVAVHPGPTGRQFARVRAAWPPRRLVAVAVASPGLTALLINLAGGKATAIPPGWTVLVALTALACAATLATYLPRPGTGLRLDVGCTPCASVAGLSVVIAAGVLSSEPHDVPTAILALGVAAFGLRQRLTDPSTCAV